MSCTSLGTRKGSRAKSSYQREIERLPRVASTFGRIPTPGAQVCPYQSRFNPRAASGQMHALPRRSIAVRFTPNCGLPRAQGSFAPIRPIIYSSPQRSPTEPPHMPASSLFDRLVRERKQFGGHVED